MHVLYIEDEVKTVQSVRQGLEEHQISMDFAYDGETGLMLARQSAYDVVICDVILPGMNGFDLVTRLREAGLRTPVLMLTALTATEHKVTGLESGADDYLVKPFEFQELLARIRALSRRSAENPYARSRLSYGNVVMNLDSRICTREDILLDLTPREFALLAYFIRNQGRVISKKEITEQVWGLDFDTGTNVIEVYVNYLRNKLDRPFDQKLIHTVFGVGYVLKR
jgi:two-component system, OmpR family, copper resistance phosphate regulon response regulator CusR